jgi:D-alanyl-D-alanine carboxypeptidase (penicillin-binding protein 5/6)
MFADTAANLDMADHPLLMDPAGLDGPAGTNGGNLISARDLAIAGRSLLANVTLAQIVATPVYYFPGPDNVQHRLTNHNKLFLTAYPGAIGIKTGFTNRAGECRIDAAIRDGRTMLAVVMNAANPDQTAMTLLDKGFATPVAAESTVDQLPAVTSGKPKPVAPPTTASAASAGPGAPQAAGHKSSKASTLDSITSSWPARVAVVVLGLMALAFARSLTRRQATPRYRQRARGGRRAA